MIVWRELLSKLNPENWFSPAYTPPSEARLHEIAINRFRELIPRCPQCGSTIDGHSYCLAAYCVLDKPRGVVAQQFMDLIDRHNWAQAFDHQEWLGTEDDLELYFFACADGKLTAAVVFSPYTFELDDVLMKLEALPDDGELAVSLRTRKWGDC